jgi:type IV secretion system protein VirB10
VLTHAVSTDVPGPIRAYVIRDVYDSLSSDVLLVPRGTLAIGHQAAHAAAGDQRILIIWTELKLPSGVSYRLPSPVAGSQDGTAGVLGDVDNHWWGRLGSAIGLSLVGAGIQLSQPQERTSVQGFAPDEGQVLAQQLGLELGRLSQEILRRGVNRPPTITLRPGERLSLLLTRDLAFAR